MKKYFILLIFGLSLTLCCIACPRSNTWPNFRFYNKKNYITKIDGKQNSCSKGLKIIYIYRIYISLPLLQYLLYLIWKYHHNDNDHSKYKWILLEKMFKPLNVQHIVNIIVMYVYKFLETFTYLYKRQNGAGEYKTFPYIPLYYFINFKRKFFL